jgi:hypothetical protein
MGEEDVEPAGSDLRRASLGVPVHRGNVVRHVPVLPQQIAQSSADAGLFPGEGNHVLRNELSKRKI